MNVTVFEAINITKKYRNTLALNQVSMSVMQGDKKIICRTTAKEKKPS